MISFVWDIAMFAISVAFTLPLKIVAIILSPVFGYTRVIRFLQPSAVNPHIMCSPTSANSSVINQIPSLRHDLRAFVSPIFTFGGRMQTLTLAIPLVRSIVRSLRGDDSGMDGCKWERVKSGSDADHYIMWPKGVQPTPESTKKPRVLVLVSPSIIQGGPASDVVQRFAATCEVLSKTTQHSWFVGVPSFGPHVVAGVHGSHSFDFGSIVDHCKFTYGDDLQIAAVGYGEGADSMLKYVCATQDTKLSAFVSVSHGCGLERSMHKIHHDRCVHLLTKLSLVGWQMSATSNVESGEDSLRTADEMLKDTETTADMALLDACSPQKPATALRRSSSTVNWTRVFGTSPPESAVAPLSTSSLSKSSNEADDTNLSPKTAIARAANGKLRKRASFGDMRVNGMSVDALYRANDSESVVRLITIPTLVIHASNDPVVPIENVPLHKLSLNPNVVVVVTPEGGHCSFPNHGGRGWVEGLVLDYFEVLLSPKETEI